MNRLPVGTRRLQLKKKMWSSQRLEVLIRPPCRERVAEGETGLIISCRISTHSDDLSNWPTPYPTLLTSTPLQASIVFPHRLPTSEKDTAPLYFPSPWPLTFKVGPERWALSPSISLDRAEQRETIVLPSMMPPAADTGAMVLFLAAVISWCKLFVVQN